MHIKSLPLFILISSGLLNAQVVPGRWEKVESLPPGQQIDIILMSGDSMNCAFKSSDSTKLTVTRDGSELTIPKDDVARIVLQKPAGRKAGRIGAGVGGAVGAAILPVVYLTNCKDCEMTGPVITGTVMLALIGAGIGARGGHAFGGPSSEVLYQAAP